MLERERALIRSADAEALAAQASRLQAALDDLAATRPPETPGAVEDLREVRAAAERNRRLLAAFMEGARGGRRDLERAAAARTALGYDSRGGAVDAGAGPRSDRRA